jgi:hypothetical protein
MRTTYIRGIISDHFHAVGTVTREMVQERAREIAIINGHSVNHCTRQDWVDAQRELTGAIPGLDDEDDQLIETAAWGEEPMSAGHAVDRMEAPDEQTICEELVEQGINEAEHDQMVEAAKSRQIL